MIIQIDIDEVPVRIGPNGALELTDADDLYSCGLVDFSVDVAIEPDGSWDIAQVYALVSKYAPGGQRQLIKMPRASDYALALDRIKANYIQGKVTDTIMQAERSEFPKAEIA